MKPPGWVKRGGFITAEKVPFQELLPLRLRNIVSGKSDKTSGVACVQEMSILFSCLKKNEFDEKACAVEVSSFQKCYTDHMTQQKEAKERDRKGILTPGEKRMSHRQANELLKKFPPPKYS